MMQLLGTLKSVQEQSDKTSGHLQSLVERDLEEAARWRASSAEAARARRQEAEALAALTRQVAELTAQHEKTFLGAERWHALFSETAADKGRALQEIAELRSELRVA